jgi:hypothetical protein
MTESEQLRLLEIIKDNCRRQAYDSHRAALCHPESCRYCRECPGHERGGKAPACCERAGEFDGGCDSGPSVFDCPKNCSCHD